MDQGGHHCEKQNIVRALKCVSSSNDGASELGSGPARRLHVPVARVEAAEQRPLYQGQICAVAKQNFELASRHTSPSKGNTDGPSDSAKPCFLRPCLDTFFRNRGTIPKAGSPSRAHVRMFRPRKAAVAASIPSFAACSSRDCIPKLST